MQVNNPIYVVRINDGEVVSLQVVDQVVHIEVPVPSVLGPTGPAGADGATILYAAVDPTTEGVDGDGYINTLTNTFFGPRAAGVWPAGVSLVGPAGPTGAAGAAGATGPQGPQGATGPTGPAGADGAAGAAGPAGPQGPAGADGRTVLYGTADPTTEGVDGDFYINTTSHFMFGPKATVWPAGISLIGPQGPAGATGPQGDTGPTGPQGAAGPGVPVGGTIGQVLKKVDGTDYNTHWADEVGGVTSVHGRTGAVVGAAADYAAVADMQAVSLLLAGSIGTGIIPLIDFSSVSDRAIEYNATLDRLEFSPKNLKINSRDALGNPHIEFGPAVAPYTEPPRVAWDRTNEKIVATRGWKIIVPPEEPIPSIALEISGGKFKSNGASEFVDASTFQGDLYGKDVYIGMDLSSGYPSAFFGGIIDAFGVPLPAGSLIYDYDLDKFTFSTIVYSNIFAATTSVVTDTVSERTADAGVTADGVLLKDSQVSTDQINEKTAAAGVTVDGLLIKDGVARIDDGYQIALDGGGAAIGAGASGFYICMWAMTITGWIMVCDSGTATIDVWKDTYANHPPTDPDSIVTPAISTGAKAQGSGLSIACAKGDILRYNVDAATATKLTLALTGTRV